jgi:hypothetical protein
MSTNDVPGMNPKNRDELHAGCWAEHKDGTLLYVLGTEDQRVIYMIFELEDKKNPVEYRDTMDIRKFQREFSYNARDPKSILWTWHDKTEFPWDRILGKFKSGVRPVSAKKQIEEAERVRRSKRKYAGQTHPVNTLPGAEDVAVKEEFTEAELETVARLVAKRLGLKGEELKHADLAHMVEREVPKGGIAARIHSRLQKAIGKLRVGDE